MNDVRSGGDEHSPKLVARLCKTAAFCGGCVVLAAGMLVMVSITMRWLMKTSVPGDVELVQAATAVAAFAFLPLGQLSRSNIVVDTFTKQLPESVCRQIDAFWDLTYALVALVLGWRLGIGAIDALRSHTITTVLGLPVGIFMCVGAILLLLLAGASLLTARRLLRSAA